MAFSLKGIAALNIGGITLHKWSGIGISKDPQEQLQRALKFTTENWKKTDVLIIDEISMLDAQLLDTLDIIGKRIRQPNDPFGGIQLIVAGDFFQLPPVPDKLTKNPTKYLFEAASWKYFAKTVELQTNFRQVVDSEFFLMLEEVKKGTVSPQTTQLLENRLNASLPSDGILPTILSSRNADVDETNKRKLDRIEFPKIPFKCVDSFRSLLDSPSHRQSELTEIFDRSIVPETLEVAISAQVMLTRNLSDTLVNGSRGYITDIKEVSPDMKKSIDEDVNLEWFSKNNSVPVVRFVDGSIVTILPKASVIQTSTIEATRTQIPLKLAYAVTIHKVSSFFSF